MYRLPVHTWLWLFVDAVLLVLCALGIQTLVFRAQSPFGSVDDKGVVRVTEILDRRACPGLEAGDQLLALDGQQLPTADAIEFLCNFHSIGDSIEVTFCRAGGMPAVGAVQAIPFYRVSYWILIPSVALFTFCLGVFVLLALPRDLSAGYLHLALVSLAVALVIASEAVTPGSLVGFAGSVLFFLSNLAVAITFYLFTTLFPKRRPGSIVRRSMILYFIAAVIAVGLTISYWHAVRDRSVDRFLVYNYWFDVLHLVVLAMVGAGIVNVIRSYRTASTRLERQRLQWVLWGLCFGPTPFLVLNVIPELFMPTGLVHEEYTLVFMVLIPTTFVISVARRHLYDIEEVIRRTTAYAIILTILLGVYVVIVTLVASFTGQIIAGAGGAILFALILEPVRNKVQREVDRRFFRIHYSFREAQSRFMSEVKTCMDERSVAVLTVQQINEYIPIEKTGFCVYLREESRLRLLAQSGFMSEGTSITLAPDAPLATQRVPIAAESVLEPGIIHETADSAAFGRWGIVLLVPVRSSVSTIQGLICLGHKKSGTRFTPDDIELLDIFAGEAGLALNRIRLQKELFEKEAESQRLEELNELKSDFVSYVSHELRTPLTSIKMFTQLLRTGGGKTTGKPEEYLSIIEGETDRLGRMVSTILDAARIDQGRKEYQYSHVDLGALAERAMEAMKYQLGMQSFTVRFNRPGRPVWINADPDAVTDAIINLIGNSIKYSAEKKWLTVKVSRIAGKGVCSVEDHGVGISAEAIPHLFEKFYRDPKQSGRVKGMGLGLSVVKHVMDAHGGMIEVASVPGRGTKFVLSFPLLQTKSSATLEGTVQ